MPRHASWVRESIATESVQPEALCVERENGVPAYRPHLGPIWRKIAGNGLPPSAQVRGSNGSRNKRKAGSVSGPGRHNAQGWESNGDVP